MTPRLLYPDVTEIRRSVGSPFTSAQVGPSSVRIRCGVKTRTSNVIRSKIRTTLRKESFCGQMQLGGFSKLFGQLEEGLVVSTQTKFQ